MIVVVISVDTGAEVTNLVELVGVVGIPYPFAVVIAGFAPHANLFS